MHAQLSSHAQILKLKLAILEGKLGNYRVALAVLVHELNDATSAEAYFMALDGDVVPEKDRRAHGPAAVSRL